MRGTKDFEYEGARYQVARLDAFTGSWILMLFLEELAKLQSEGVSVGGPEPQDAPQPQDAELSSQATAMFLMRKLSRKQLAEVEEACLGVCGKLQEVGGREVPMPIMVAGRFAFPELEYDGGAVAALVRESLAFNLSPTSPAPVSATKTEPPAGQRSHPASFRQ